MVHTTPDLIGYFSLIDLQSRQYLQKQAQQAITIPCCSDDLTFGYQYVGVEALKRQVMTSYHCQACKEQC